MLTTARYNDLVPGWPGRGLTDTWLLSPDIWLLPMAQRRFHYEQAFEHYLRSNRVPYVAVDEAKKALLPADQGAESIKSFDFVVYTDQRNLLIDIKGRMYGSDRTRGSVSGRAFESWVTREDIDGLEHWQRLFGEGFAAVFVFVYCLRVQPPDALFEEVFEYGGRWYALREVSLDDYRRVMVPRSSKWGTVCVPAEAFRRISRPFSVRGKALRGPGDACDAAPAALS